ncbi:MAG: penicillin acylase family protein [Desulfobacterales bacterium]|nr:penicillin acylase family protein [Desulfobacterales bacterium]
MLKNISPENLALLERYCTGVNAYLERHKDKLPAGTSAGRIHAGTTGNPSTPSWCTALVDLALSFNLSRRDRIAERRPGHGRSKDRMAAAHLS